MEINVPVNCRKTAKDL